MNYIAANRLLLVVFMFSIFSSCHEDPLSIAPENVDSEVDQEMIDAEALADAYLESLGDANARSFAKNHRSVTNLRYRKDDLLFKTLKATKGYEPIDEQTVTAEATEGSFIFWNPGGGVKEIEGIEFDQASSKYLQFRPFALRNGLWVTRIKPKKKADDDEDDNEDEDDDEEDEGDENHKDAIYLKYDIIYQTKTSGDTPIRLDPKVKFRQK